MLVDTFGREHTYLRISVTDRCNLRCVYCMPPEGIAWREREEILTLEEIARVAGLFTAMGIRKIRLTGGEPTVRKGIETLVAQLAALPGLETLGMTTNGVALPAMARGLRASGLTALNVSLDTLREDRFEQIARRARLEDVRAGIREALAAGFAPLKLNVVVMGGINDDELLDFVALVADKPINVRFIEYMPFKGNEWNAARFIPCRAMVRAIEARHRLVPVEEAAGVAKEFRVPGFQGTVSFISPLSEEFCQSCTRLRLTADGSIKTCLFFPAEVGLRDPLRGGASDAELSAVIRGVVRRKPRGHLPVEELVAANDRSMVEIGG